MESLILRLAGSAASLLHSSKSMHRLAATHLTLTTWATTSELPDLGGIYHLVPVSSSYRGEHECLWLARVIGGRKGSDRCAWLESGRSNRSPEFHFQFPNCGTSLSLTRAGRG